MTSYSFLSEVLAITSPFFLKKIIEKESRVKGKRELSFLFLKKNSQTRMHLRWNEYPPSSSLHFPFLKLSTRCIQDKVGGGIRKKETAKGRTEGRKGAKSSWWGFWLYRLKGMRCKKRVVGPAAKVSSRGQGGGTVFSWPPGIKERRSTGASTNYYCTLPPGRRQGRTTLDSNCLYACVSRCPRFFLFFFLFLFLFLFFFFFFFFPVLHHLHLWDRKQPVSETRRY